MLHKRPPGLNRDGIGDTSLLFSAPHMFGVERHTASYLVFVLHVEFSLFNAGKLLLGHLLCVQKPHAETLASSFVLICVRCLVFIRLSGVLKDNAMTCSSPHPISCVPSVERATSPPVHIRHRNTHVGHLLFTNGQTKEHHTTPLPVYIITSL